MFGVLVCVCFAPQDDAPANLYPLRYSLARTQNTDGTFSCTVCPKGSYKIANDGGCHLCPTKGAVCLGGDQIYVTDGASDCWVGARGAHVA